MRVSENVPQMRLTENTKKGVFIQPLLRPFVDVVFFFRLVPSGTRLPRYSTIKMESSTTVLYVYIPSHLPAFLFFPSGSHRGNQCQVEFLLLPLPFFRLPRRVSLFAWWQNRRRCLADDRNRFPEESRSSKSEEEQGENKVAGWRSIRDGSRKCHNRFSARMKRCYTGAIVSEPTVEIVFKRTTTFVSNTTQMRHSR